ncbi:MAG: LptF/LptG family permease [Bacteroidales bacterium]|jgi:lipopolysaccharide export system permease protein|nr:LptF/LptG family permease [Bacteroidales bacterium]
MLKIIDLYIIKKILGTFFFTLLIIMCIAVIFDIQEKYEDFVSNQAPLKEIIVDYYLNFIPYYANLFTNLFVFITAIFVTSKMASNTEIIAIHASGISFNRFLRPYFVATTVIAILSWVLIMYIIPLSNTIKIGFEDRYVYNKVVSWERNIHRQVRPGEFVYIESYNVDSDNAFRLAMEKFDENGVLQSKLTSDYARWNPETERWDVYNYVIRDMRADGQILRKGQLLDTVFYLTPADFKMRNKYVERMNIDELNEYIETQRLQGTDNINLLLVEKHKRWSFPFSNFILMLLGVCLSNKKKRGGTVVNIVIGFALAFMYIMLFQVTTTFTIYANLDPFLAVWLPNILYAVVCFFLYRNAKI